MLPSSPTGYGFSESNFTNGVWSPTTTQGMTVYGDVYGARNGCNSAGQPLVTIVGSQAHEVSITSTSGTTVPAYQDLLIFINGDGTGVGTFGYQTTKSGVTNDNDPATSSSVVLTIPLPGLAAPPGQSGSVAATMSTGSGSALFNGGASSVNIATVGANTVSLVPEGAPAITGTTGTLGTIDIKENAGGVLYNTTGNPVMSLTLPSGFTWNTPTSSEFVNMGGADPNNTATVYNHLTSPYTDTATSADMVTTGNIGKTVTYGYELSNNNAELDFYDTDPYVLTGNKSPASPVGGQWIQFTGSVTVNTSTAQAGNITINVGGTAATSTSTVVAGTYGGNTFTVTPTVATAPTIVAGKAAATVGEIELQESSPGSIVWGRTITLTLPNDVAWAQSPTLDPNNSTNTGNIGSNFNGWTVVPSSNGTEIQVTLTAPSGITSSGPTYGDDYPGLY